jgi:predicted PurR-regulated permease PerM
MVGPVQTPTFFMQQSSKIPAVVLSSALLTGLLAAVGIVLRPFLLPLLWAIVLTVATWPIFTRLRTLVPKRPWVASLSLSLLLALALLVVAIPLPLQLAGELRQLGQRLSTVDIGQLSKSLADVPVIGPPLSEHIAATLSSEGGLSAVVAANQETLIRFATKAAVSVMDTVAVVFMTLIGCFVLYNHGEILVAQTRTIARKLGATRADYIFDYVAMTVRGAAYSVVATAIAQGTLAGIGYAVAGAPLPALLALCTMVFSLIPFGAPVIYVPVSFYVLFASGLPWYYGAGLLLWGAACISTIDNLLRSILISQTTRVSAIIVFMGVLGGVLAFGLLGVFIGPALVGVAQTLWLDFAESERNQNHE